MTFKDNCAPPLLFPRATQPDPVLFRHVLKSEHFNTFWSVNRAELSESCHFHVLLIIIVYTLHLYSNSLFLSYIIYGGKIGNLF